MIIAFSYTPVLEKILMNRIKEYFYNIIDWKGLYPNFSKIRINNEFPWVPYMDQNPTGLPDIANIKGLFPSITIVNTSDSNSIQQFIPQFEGTLDKSEFEDFKVRAAEDWYTISPAALLAMETHFATNDKLVGVTIKYKRQDIINIDITVDDNNTIIKDSIYDFLELYLTTHGLKELSKDFGIGIYGNQISGNRASVYNMDFGRLLRGSSIQFPADYIIQQTYYDTDAKVINDIVIKHNVSIGGTNGQER